MKVWGLPFFSFVGFVYFVLWGFCSEVFCLFWLVYFLLRIMAVAQGMQLFAVLEGRISALSS